MNSFKAIEWEFTLSFCNYRPKCSIRDDSFLPASFITNRDPKRQTGYSSGAISIMKILRDVLAVPILKLVPSELVKARDYSLSSGLSVPLTERMKLEPLHTNTSS